ncbi:hypothetical protein MNV49_005236 [Pseudohyphozyma bogoriensis]|nr:hypothetical protein MNV49_005236 [Pseudohyphozyma bogoriensis]
MLNPLYCSFDMFAGPFVLPSLVVQPQDLTGKHAIVTGGNVGIGLECARKLAAMGASVTLACRDAAKGEVARQDIVATTGNSDVVVSVLDCSKLQRVREFVKRREGKPVDILIKWVFSLYRNAGMTAYKLEHTEDGYESTFITNFLSHVLLTVLLLPSLQPHARIVNVSSLGHYAATKEDLDMEDLDNSKQLEKAGVKEGDVLANTAFALYSKSKLCQVIFTKVLQAKLDASESYGEKKIVVSSCHPGLVRSTIWGRHLDGENAHDKTLSRLTSLVNAVGITAEQGACTPTFVAVDPAAGLPGGGYWDSRQTRRPPNSLMEDHELCERLYNTWLDKCGVSVA